MNIQQVVGDNVRFIRESRDWTQEDLAIVAKVSKTYIGQVERGETAVTITVLHRIAKALKTDIALLVTKDGYKRLE